MEGRSSRRQMTAMPKLEGRNSICSQVDPGPELGSQPRAHRFGDGSHNGCAVSDLAFAPDEMGGVGCLAAVFVNGRWSTDLFREIRLRWERRLPE